MRLIPLEFSKLLANLCVMRIQHLGLCMHASIYTHLPSHRSYRCIADATLRSPCYAVLNYDVSGVQVAKRGGHSAPPQVQQGLNQLQSQPANL